MLIRLRIFLIIFFLSFNIITHGQTINISGRVYDKEEGNIINNGIIFLNPGNQTTPINQNGAYLINTLPGKKEITAQIMGYKRTTIRFVAFSDSIINIYLQVSPFELSGITILGDSIKNVEITPAGSFILTPASLRETPRLFSEPDLLRSFQMLPGVVAGKDGSSDIFVRGGGVGQNIILANGCYFFLPGHMLGFISPYDLDFLESAELYKDYFPAELGGGASSVISLDFKRPKSDSLSSQLRLGLLSSGITVDLPLVKPGLDITAGLKRGNYSIYAPLLKKIVSNEVSENLPPDDYSFYDGFFRLSRSSQKYGEISYLLFANYDKGKDIEKTRSQNADTIINYTSGLSNGWNNMVHALQWQLPENRLVRWKFNLNYNKISMGREIFMQTEKLVNGSNPVESSLVSYSFSPTINSIGSSAIVNIGDNASGILAGVTNRIRFYDPNNITTSILEGKKETNVFGESGRRVIEPAAFITYSVLFAEQFQLTTGVRVSGGIIDDAKFLVLEPRLRLAHDQGGPLSPHINYVRLSQFDHSVEGSNAGLRSMLWLPISEFLGPEISDVFSAGVQGQVNNNLIWTLDGYYKKTSGMVDFKPGASFIFDESLEDMLDRINGRAYGLEMGMVKMKGKLTGSASYTYSRSKREWFAPEGLIWIPSSADRPHNLNITSKYHFNARTSFGFNWIFTSGSPATIYMHETSYGEFFETKNNIRYFDYHRLDLSYRHTIYKRKFSFLIDVDIYNVYNRKNTFYFLQAYDEDEKRYYYKNISLFPVMPSLTLTLKY